MGRDMITRRRLLVAAPLLMVPAGCSVLQQPQAAQIYRLSPAVPDPPAPPLAHGALTVDLPTASQSLDTDRIALTQGRTRFDYYAASVWTDRLPDLLQSLMIESFESDGRLAAVTRGTDGFATAYRLRTDIRQFEAAYPPPPAVPPEIAVVLELQLSTGLDERLVGSRLVSVQARAAGTKLDAIVAAFDTATGEALAQTVAWTVAAMAG